MNTSIDPVYLRPTSIIDSDNEKVIAYALKKTQGAEDDVSRAVSLFYAVRDEIRYTPYYPFYLPEHYRAGRVLDAGCGYCVPKAALLCALGRVCGIPSRLGFAHVRNHLSTTQLREYMGTDLFVFHGYNEFYLNGCWVKATAAFNKELCQHFGVGPIEFDGRHDAMLQETNSRKERFMEYVEYVGTFDDVPLGLILRGWEEAYGVAKVQSWIDGFEKGEGMLFRKFNEEEPLKD